MWRRKVLARALWYFNIWFTRWLSPGRIHRNDKTELIASSANMHAFDYDAYCIITMFWKGILYDFVLSKCAKYTWNFVSLKFAYHALPKSLHFGHVRSTLLLLHIWMCVHTWSMICIPIVIRMKEIERQKWWRKLELLPTGLLPDTQNGGMRMHQGRRERVSSHQNR